MIWFEPVIIVEEADGVPGRGIKASIRRCGASTRRPGIDSRHIAEPRKLRGAPIDLLTVNGDYDVDGVLGLLIPDALQCPYEKLLSSAESPNDEADLQCTIPARRKRFNVMSS